MIPDGWQLVPKKPTDEMWKAVSCALTGAKGWEAALAAAPSPPEILTMTRDEIGMFYDAAKQVESALMILPYRAAHAALRELGEMRSLVGDQLPGGYYGKCVGCKEVKGTDEMVNCGDDDLCRDCVKKSAA